MPEENKSFLVQFLYIFIVVSLIFVILGIGFFVTQSGDSKNNSSKNGEKLNYAIAQGDINTNKNEQLSENINAYMQTKVKSNYEGKENFYCSNILYGYDNKFAYAWVFCSGLKLQDNGNIELGTGFSLPSRFEFNQIDYKIIKYDQPLDGDLYQTSLAEIFPKKMYDLAIKHPTNNQIEVLQNEVKLKISTISKEKAEDLIAEKYTNLKSFLTYQPAPRSISYNIKDKEWYLMYVQYNKSIISKSWCYKVSKDNEVIKTGEYTNAKSNSFIATKDNVSVLNCRQKYDIIISGQIVCLPLKNTSVKKEECKIGLKGIDSSYYDLDSTKNSDYQNLLYNALNKNITIFGTFVNDISNKYLIYGTIVINTFNILQE